MEAALAAFDGTVLVVNRSRSFYQQIRCGSGNWKITRWSDYKTSFYLKKKKLRRLLQAAATETTYVQKEGCA